MRKRGPLLAAMIVVILLQAAPALAHAERIGSTPKEKARLGTPPDIVHIEFSEPPIGDATFIVLDGCERDVVEGIEVGDKEIDATLAAGQPGRWEVQTRVVSGVDGHATSDSWNFSVKGEPDCSDQAADDQPDGRAGSGDDGPEGGGGSFPLLAFAGGTLLVIILALAFRGRSG